MEHVFFDDYKYNFKTSWPPKNSISKFVFIAIIKYLGAKFVGIGIWAEGTMKNDFCLPKYTCTIIQS